MEVQESSIKGLRLNKFSHEILSNSEEPEILKLANCPFIPRKNSPRLFQVMNFTEAKITDMILMISFRRIQKPNCKL